MSKSILEKYDSYEESSAADRAWITIRAKKAGKNVKQAHAAVKAHFTRIQNATTVTIVKEDSGYLGGCCHADPIYHVIKARSADALRTKISDVYDEIINTHDKDSQEYKDAVASKEDNLDAMIFDLESIKITDTELQIISNPDCVMLR